MFLCLRPDFTSKLVRGLAFGTPKFYIAPYDRINHGFVNVSSNCDVKSGLKVALTVSAGVSCSLFMLRSDYFLFCVLSPSISHK